MRVIKIKINATEKTCVDENLQLCEFFNQWRGSCSLFAANLFEIKEGKEKGLIERCSACLESDCNE